MEIPSNILPDERIQVKNWANGIIGKYRIRVKNIRLDCADGVIFLRIIETVTGQPVGIDWSQQPKDILEKRTNVQAAISFLENNDIIPKNSISIDDIIWGEEKYSFAFLRQMQKSLKKGQTKPLNKKDNLPKINQQSNKSSQPNNKPGQSNQQMTTSAQQRSASAQNPKANINKQKMFQMKYAKPFNPTPNVPLYMMDKKTEKQPEKVSLFAAAKSKKPKVFQFDAGFFKGRDPKKSPQQQQHDNQQPQSQRQGSLFKNRKPLGNLPDERKANSAMEGKRTKNLNSSGEVNTDDEENIDELLKGISNETLARYRITDDMPLKEKRRRILMLREDEENGDETNLQRLKEEDELGEGILSRSRILQNGEGNGNPSNDDNDNSNTKARSGNLELGEYANETPEQREKRLEEERKKKEEEEEKQRKEEEEKPQHTQTEEQRRALELAEQQKKEEEERRALELAEQKAKEEEEERKKKEEEEKRQKEEEERRALELAEQKAKEEEEQKRKEEEERIKKEEEEQKAKEEEERRALELAEQKAKEEEERKKKEEEERKRKEEEEERKRKEEEEERKRKEEEERKKKEEEEKKAKEEAEKKAKEEAERKAKEEAEKKAKEEAERKAKEEAERKAKEEAEKKAKEEAEKKAKEEAEKKAKEEAEKKAKEEAERKAKEEAEKKAKEEAEKKAKEEAEKKAKEEAEKKAKEEAEKKAKEEAEKKAKEEAEKKKKQEAERRAREEAERKRKEEEEEPPIEVKNQLSPEQMQELPPPLPRSNYVVGIDFGTATTRFGIYKDGKLNEKMNEWSIPSAIAFDDKGNKTFNITDEILNDPSFTIVSATKRYLGRDVSPDIAENLTFDIQSDTLSKTIGNSKSGTKRATVRIGNECLTFEQIAALVLGEAKRIIDDQMKEDVVDAVICVPGFFSNNQKVAMRDATAIAGFQVKKLVTETAAVMTAFHNNSVKIGEGTGDGQNIAYSTQNQKSLVDGAKVQSNSGNESNATGTAGDTTKDGSGNEAKNATGDGIDGNRSSRTSNPDEKKAVVVDFGAGTLDASIVGIEEDSITIHRTSGDTNLGGIDIDIALAQFVLTKIPTDKADAIKGDHRAMRLLFKQCEKYRIEGLNRVTVPKIIDDYDLDVEITADEFRDILKPFGERLESCLEELFKRNNRTRKHDISEVVLVGGVSNMPALTQVVNDFMKTDNPGKFQLRHLDSNAAMAGAAIQGAIFIGDGSVKPVSVKNTMALSIGFSLADGTTSVLIPRGTVLPASFSTETTTFKDNQKNVGFDIIEGERKMAADNIKLGNVCVTDIQKAPRGVPKIIITMDINEEGLLIVTAHDKTTGSLIRSTINSQNKLTKEEVRRMIAEAEANKQADKYARKQAESRAKLTFYVNEIKSKGKDIDDPQFKEKVEYYLKWISEHQAEKPSVYLKMYSQAQKELKSYVT